MTLLMSLTIFAQRGKEIRNTVQINAVSAIDDFYEVQYERVTRSQESLTFSFGSGMLMDKSGSNANDDFYGAFRTNSYNDQDNTRRVEGITASLGYRFYFFNQEATRGFYVGPKVQYLNFNETYTYTNAKSSQLEVLEDENHSMFIAQGDFGYQWVIANLVNVNPFVVAGITVDNSFQSDGKVDAYGSGISLNLGVRVGIGF